jgi:hypothetical protein
VKTDFGDLLSLVQDLNQVLRRKEVKILERRCVVSES